MKASKKRTFKTESADQWQTALVDALKEAGAVLADFEFSERATFKQTISVTETIEIEEGQTKEIEVQKLLLCEWLPVECKAKDEEGEFIVTETDEEGNPTAYQMEPGYHVNLADAYGLTFAEGLEVFPEVAQNKWS